MTYVTDETEGHDCWIGRRLGLGAWGFRISNSELSAGVRQIALQLQAGVVAGTVAGTHSRLAWAFACACGVVRDRPRQAHALRVNAATCILATVRPRLAVSFRAVLLAVAAPLLRVRSCEPRLVRSHRRRIPTVDIFQPLRKFLLPCCLGTVESSTRNECPFPLSRRAQKDLNHQITLQKKTKVLPGNGTVVRRHECVLGI